MNQPVGNTVHFISQGSCYTRPSTNLYGSWEPVRCHWNKIEANAYIMNILSSKTQHTNKGAICVGLLKRLFVCILYISKWKVELGMDNLHTGQVSHHFFFWQATRPGLTQITTLGGFFGPWFFIILKIQIKIYLVRGQTLFWVH